MGDSLARLRRDLIELRQDVLELLADGQLAAYQGISLSAFARLVGLETSTLKRDLRSEDPGRRHRWPAFDRPADGRGEEHTTAEDVRAWRGRHCTSTHVTLPAPRGRR